MPLFRRAAFVATTLIPPRRFGEAWRRGKCITFALWPFQTKAKRRTWEPEAAPLRTKSKHLLLAIENNHDGGSSRPSRRVPSAHWIFCKERRPVSLSRPDPAPSSKRHEGPASLLIVYQLRVLLSHVSMPAQHLEVREVPTPEQQGALSEVDDRPLPRRHVVLVLLYQLQQVVVTVVTKM